jgi:hypothetical protein
LGKALYQAYLDRITAADKHHRDSIRRPGGRERLWRANRKDYVYIILNKLLGKLRKTLFPTFAVARHNEDVLTFNIT